MPQAAQVDKLAAGTASVPGTAPVVSPDLQSPQFAQLNSWISSDGPATYTLWLLEHPGFLIGAPFEKPPLTFNNANGDIGFYAAPNRISTSTLDRLLYPGLWGELATLAVALAFVLWRSGMRREVLAVTILGALGPVSMLLSWQGDGQEVTRHMVEGAVETRLAILVGAPDRRSR